MGFRQNYLLFHSVVEIGSVVVACLMGFLALSIPKANAIRWLRDRALYLVVAAVDVLQHPGFQGEWGYSRAFRPTCRPSSGFWPESWNPPDCSPSSFPFKAPVFPRIFHRPPLFSIAGLAAVFSGRFPDCYLPETGLTFFKIFAEWGSRPSWSFRPSSSSVLKTRF